MDDLILDSKWGKSCESFLNLVDNKLKDHKGIAPDPTQYPDSWYINRLNRTLESHTTLYQYIVNHQMQAESIANHLGTTSATILTYKSHVETIRTFCQTIDHANWKLTYEKNRRKALQAEFQRTPGRGRGCINGQGDGRGRNAGQGTHTGRNQGGCNPTSGRGRTGGRYHNWIPRDQFDNLDEESYQRLIRDRVARGEVRANTTDSTHVSTTPSDPHATHYSAPVSQVQVPPTSTQDTPSVITGTAPPGTCTPARTTSMAMVTPSPSIPGTTTSTHMDSGPNTLLRQLMSNTSVQSSRVPNHDGQSVTTSFQGQRYQV